MNNSLDGIIVIDECRRIVEFNPAAEKLFGLSRNEAKGRDMAELLIPPRLRGAHRRGTEAVGRGEPSLQRGTRMETVAVRADGSEFPIELSIAPLVGTGPNWSVGYIRDISERVRAEALLRNQNELTRTIATHVAEPLFLLDAENRITYANPAAERTFLWSISELRGAKLHALTGCACERGLRCPQIAGIPKASDNTPIIEQYYEAAMSRKDGERLEVVCEHSPIVKDGAVVAGVLMVRDVTAQRLAERQLQALWQRTEGRMANFPLALVEFTPEYVITRWSPEAERLLGWMASEVVGKSAGDCPWVAPDLRQNSSRRATARGPAKDGRIVEVEWYHSQVRDADGKLLSVLALGLDVTERNSAVNALRDSEERFRATMEHAATGLAHLSLDGRFMLVNESFCRTVGYIAQELIGRPYHDIVHPDDIAPGAEDLCALIGGQIQSYARDKRYIRKDGMPVWVSVRSSLIRNAGGAPHYVVAVLTDITERKRASDALRQGRDRYQFLAESMPQIVFTATADGAVDYASRQWGDYTGAPDSALRWGWAEWVDSEQRQVSIERWKRAVEAGSPFEMEARFRRADGVHRWHLVRATVLRDGNGAIIQWVGTCTDIEDQKQAEADLERKVRERTIEAEEQAWRAEQANRAKSEFLATMSHEIRTPMSVIVGLADMLWESDLAADQREYTRVLRKAGEALLTVVNDILDVSAVEARRLKVEQIDFDLGSVVDGVVAIMLPRAKERGLKLVCEMNAGVPKRVIGDPNRLRQILINLMGNATKFTESGSVALRIRSAEGAPGTLTFSVIDTGIGIPDEKLQLIFEPFSQADSSTTRKYGGTGLGLTISRQLVELMNGHIRVKSEPGGGSEFSFTIPFHIQPEQPLDTEPVPIVDDGPAIVASSGAERRVLLVDDSIDNVFLVQTYLKASEFLIDVASDGAEAVSRVKSGRYDVVLMDINMPVMDGHTATRAIRSWEVENHRRPVPILALTAHAAPSEVDRSREAGCTAHLTKPIQRNMLLAELARHIVGHRATRIVATAPEGLAELSGRYLAKRKDALPVIRELVESGEYERVRGLAHNIKGTGASYGFLPLTDVARELERAAASRDLERMRDALGAMEEYVNAVEIEAGG